MFRTLLTSVVGKTFRSLTVFRPVSHGKATFQAAGQTLSRPFSITSAMKALTLNTEYIPHGTKKSPGTKKDWEDERFLHRIHLAGPKLPRIKRHPLNNRPQMKGIVLKTLIRKPKKPNSANRKCVLIRLSNGKEATAFVPGIGHNLQEHSVVLVQKKRVRDVPGLKLRVIRGALDCSHVIKQSR